MYYDGDLIDYQIQLVILPMSFIINRCCVIERHDQFMT